MLSEKALKGLSVNARDKKGGVGQSQFFNQIVKINRVHRMSTIYLKEGGQDENFYEINRVCFYFRSRISVLCLLQESLLLHDWGRFRKII